MSDFPPHFCPGCGAEQRAVPRYPWYFCRACLDSACDGAGQALDFFNASISGGFCWRFRDQPASETRKGRGAICLIRGRKVIVHEARFGGIVAEPSSSLIARPDGYWLLTGPDPMAPD